MPEARQGTTKLPWNPAIVQSPVTSLPVLSYMQWDISELGRKSQILSKLHPKADAESSSCSHSGWLRSAKNRRSNS